MEAGQKESYKWRQIKRELTNGGISNGSHLNGGRSGAQNETDEKYFSV